MSFLTHVVLTTSVVLPTALAILSPGPTPGNADMTGMFGQYQQNPASTAIANNVNYQSGPAPNSFSQMFNNPMGRFFMAGQENLMRAYAMPYLSRMGLRGSNAAKMSFLTGGFENYMDAMMSDMLSQKLAQSGMNPLASALLTTHIADAPDGYFHHNVLFNQGQQRASQQQAAQQAQQAAMAPDNANPAAASGGSGYGSFDPMALMTFSAFV